MNKGIMMKDADLKGMLTVEQWGAWKRYCAKYSIIKSGDEWPEYDVNEFMHILDIVIEKESEPVTAEPQIHGLPLNPPSTDA